MPKTDPFPYHKTNIKSLKDDPDYDYLIKESPFSITITRKNTNEEIFSTKNSEIIFDENYTYLKTTLPSEYIFELGERTTSFKLKLGVYTIYNRDANAEIEDG